MFELKLQIVIFLAIIKFTVLDLKKLKVSYLDWFYNIK